MIRNAWILVLSYFEFSEISGGNVVAGLVLENRKVLRSNVCILKNILETVNQERNYLFLVFITMLLQGWKCFLPLCALSALWLNV